MGIMVLCATFFRGGVDHLKNDYFYEVVNGVVKSSGYFSSTCAVVLGPNIGSH